MKTITAKEFQENHAGIVKAAREGQSFEITFHRKPVARLVPVDPSGQKKPKPGSYEAVLASLQHTIQSTGDLHDLSYKELRGRMIEEKYGRFSR